MLKSIGSACLLAALAVGRIAHSDPSGSVPCRAEVGIEPASAFVGEQIQHHVRILWRPPVERVEWLRAPFFPDHRAEALAQVTTPRSVASEDARWEIQDERRALFAARPGRLEIASATLRCVVRDARGDVQPLDVEIAAASVEARALPTDGRTADFSGLVGPVEFRRSASADRVRIGESVAITLEIRGEGNVWVAPLELPIDDEASEAPRYRVFPTSDETDQSNDGRLVTRRRVRVEWVAQRAGRLVVPAQHVDWFDAESGGYRRTSVSPIAIDVIDEPTPTPGPASPTAGVHGATSGSSGRGLSSLGRTALAAIVIGGLSFAAGSLFYRARPGRRALESALAAAAAARLRGDPRREAEALERAVRAVLAMRSPALAGLSHPELEMRGGNDEALVAAAALLANLELDRYGGPAREPDRDAVQAWIAAAIR